MTGTTFAYSLSEYVVQIIAGLGAGAVLFLIASGLTLIFGALRVINFAHGSLYMLGAYITFSLTPVDGMNNATFWLIMLGAALVVAAGSIIMEVFFFRPIYRRPLLTQLLVTFAFVLIIAGIVREFWGPQSILTDTPPFLQGSVVVLDGRVPKYVFFFMAMAVVVGVLLWALLYKTGLGRMIRAAVSDPVLLGLSGVNVRVLFTGVFVLAAFFAGLAGAIVSVQGSVSPDFAVDSIIRAFVVVVIGGLGSLGGAFIAALLVGVAEALGILWVPQASLAIVFAVLVVVLAIRPQGLLGQRTA
jgi:branched-subunit amino acid ABC-type transport system permease component